MHPQQQYVSRFLTRSLSSKVPVSLAPLQVLRIFFNLTIILYHGAFYLAVSLSSGAPADALINDFSSVPSATFQLVYFGFRYGVDIFLFISGFFMASKFSSALQKSVTLPFILRYFLLRWLRLAPMYLLVSLAYRILGNGLCPNWVEILQVANFFSSTHDRCIIVGWSTIVDFQSHVVIGLLALIAGTMRRTQFLLFCCIICSGFARVWYWYYANFPALPIMFTAQDAENKEFLSLVHKLPLGTYDISKGEGALRKAAVASYYPLYFSQHYRLAPCMLGFLTWTGMHQRTRFYLKVVQKPLLSLMAAITLISLDFKAILYSHPQLDTFSVPVSGLHEGIGSILVLIGISVIVMISCSVEEETLTQELLSSRSTKAVLSIVSVWPRFLYAIYLAHPLILRSLHWWGPEMSDDRFNPEQIILRGLVLYIATLMLSVVLALLEQPFLDLRRWFSAKTAGIDSGGVADNRDRFKIITTDTTPRYFASHSRSQLKQSQNVSKNKQKSFFLKRVKY